MKVSREKPGDYGFLLCAQGTFYFRPLRSQGSQDDQVGEAGPVEW
jgi:hypothetical protein